MESEKAAALLHKQIYAAISRKNQLGTDQLHTDSVFMSHPQPQDQQQAESGISNEDITQARRHVQAAEQLFLQKNLLAGE